MKLSDAIKLGAMLKPQAFHGPLEPMSLNQRSCALAAAAEAVGLEQLNVYREPWRGGMWAWVQTPRRTACPQCGERMTYLPDVGALIAHLNDCHRWTREQIADWIATLEPTDVPTVLDTAHAEVTA